MDDGKIAMIRNARAELRQRGEVDTQRAVHRKIGGSRHTLSRYWHLSAPRLPGPTDAPATPAPRSAASPGAPPPGVSLEALRAHYFGGTTITPWPTPLPVEAYGLLQTLWQEANAAIGQADRDRYATFNRLAQARGNLDTHPELVAAEHRRGVARLRLSTIQSDMEGVRRRGHDQGVTLPDPRLHH